MLPDLQLVTEPNDFWKALSRCLIGSGYKVSRSDPSAPFLSDAPPPAVYIIDLSCFSGYPQDHWDTFVFACKEQKAGCLAYSSEGPCDHTAISLLKPWADILFNPLDPSEVFSRIEALLANRRLNLQLEMAETRTKALQEELREALHSAAQIKRRLIPASWVRYKSLNYAWHFMPSKQVGGDLFNVAQLDEQTIMTYLVDVSGHGISSAMVSVAVHQGLSPHTGQIPKRQTAHPPYYEITAPAIIMKALEKEYPFERFDEFFTIVYLLLNAQNGRVRYCCAGHPPPILIRKNGQVERLSTGGTIIGLGDLFGFEEAEIQLNDGDRLYLYTDGITEHGASQGQGYGEQSLIENLSTPQPKGLEGVLDHTVGALLNFRAGLLPQDDVTLIGIEYSEPAEGAD